MKYTCNSYTLVKIHVLFQRKFRNYNRTLFLIVASVSSAGMTGADIANVVNEAALSAVRMNSVTVNTCHFEEALHRVIAGAAKKNRVLYLMERERLATHEAGHAVVGWMLKHTDPLLRVSETRMHLRELYMCACCFEEILIIRTGFVSLT